VEVLPLDSSRDFGGLQQLYEMHHFNLDQVLTSFFLSNSNPSLERVSYHLDEFYAISSSLFDELISFHAANDGLARAEGEACSLSRLRNRYCENRRVLDRSLRMTASADPFCGDLLRMLTGTADVAW
jgi:hypothetical protein